VKKFADNFDRRSFLRKSIKIAGGSMLARSPLGWTAREGKKTLFNGRNLDGWIMAENSGSSIGSGDIADLAAMAKAITVKSNGVALYLNGALDETVRADLAVFDPSNTVSAQAIRSAFGKNLTAIIKGPSIYEKARLDGVTLQPATERLIHSNPQGLALVEANRMLLVDAFPGDLTPSKVGWAARDGVMASTGSGRGVIYTKHDYGRFRWMFTIRHVSGNPDHQACVLIFCTRPGPNEIPLDALGGIQFQVPRGGHWDYRLGHNNAGEGEFSQVTKVSYDPHEWSSVEIVADAAAGRARMAVAQPAGSKAVEVLDFSDQTAGKVGPIALQMHNQGLFDEYKDLTVEVNPKSMDLMTTAS
jgi:hypothetical protein